MPERLNGAVSKTVMELVSIVGSNPTLSAAMIGTLTFVQGSLFKECYGHYRVGPKP